MSSKRSRPVRVSRDFDEWTKKIIHGRYIKGKDKVPLRIPRLTKAITRVPKLKEILEDADIYGE